MKAYSFLQEATLQNYFKRTFGTFRFLFSGKNYQEVALKANLKGFKPIHLSKNMYGDPSSAYFIDSTGSQLLRISDHWSETNIGNVFECGWIKSCYWRLLGRQGSTSKGKIQAGIIDLNKLADKNLYGTTNNAIKSTQRFFGDTLRPTYKKQKLSVLDIVKDQIRRDKEEASKKLQ